MQNIDLIRSDTKDIITTKNTSQECDKRYPKKPSIACLDGGVIKSSPADHFPYTISKAALASMTRSLAVALAPDIIVNGLALGAILPPSDGKAKADILRNVPAGRWVEENEIERALLLLLTCPAYITGEIIHVDGGRHLV